MSGGQRAEQVCGAVGRARTCAAVEPHPAITSASAAPASRSERTIGWRCWFSKVLRRRSPPLSYSCASPLEHGVGLKEAPVLGAGVAVTGVASRAASGTHARVGTTSGGSGGVVSGDASAARFSSAAPQMWRFCAACSSSSSVE